MNIRFHPRRDDYTDRLFSYLKSVLPFPIKAMTKIRDRVFLLQTKETFFMLKAYPSQEKLVQQQVFTKELIPEFTARIHRQNLWKKWRDRAEVFKRNTKIVSYFVPKQLTAKIMDWSHMALDGMGKNIEQLKAAEPVILHGDVAHHNFLRDKTGSLFLIDFDLISTGPANYDLLQYANRILPFMNWSLNSLSEMKGFSGCLSNKAFLYGLMYPADIFREWNRVIRLKSYYNPARISPIMDLTVKQFKARSSFIEQVKKLAQ